MAISRRLRYEILRRDNHTCRYCGGQAPDVTLTVDHVVPVALGGNDQPENLVAACADCNAGKASTNPDAPLVADVQQAALKWQLAIGVAAKLRERDRQKMRLLTEDVINYWTTEWQRYGIDPCPLPAFDAAGSIAVWYGRGMGLTDFLEMVDATLNGYFRRGSALSVAKCWDYFAGCCWSRITEIETAAHQIIDDGKV